MKTGCPWIRFVSMLMLAAPLTSGAYAEQSAVSAHTGLRTSHIDEQHVRWVVEVQQPNLRSEVSDRTIPITLRPVMLAHNIEELAGQTVKILNARVVGVFEPHAFLVESSNRHQEIIGRRDRILVLIDAAKLRVPTRSIEASTVQVLGVASTLLGVQVSREGLWPTELDRNRLRRLEVRAAVVATSVQTAEGTELTDRESPPALPR